MFADSEMAKGQFSNGLTAAQEEMFQLLEEECAELIQAVSKIRRHGPNSDYRGSTSTNVDNLHEECADVLACIAVLSKNGFINPNIVNHISRQKLDRIRDPATRRVHFITPDMIP